MAINPNIILSGNQMAQPRLPDVNAMTQTRTAGMENIYKIEQARAEQARVAQKEQAATEEKAMIEAVLPAYLFTIETGDAEGGFDLLPPQYQESFRPLVDQLAGKPPEQVRAAVYGSLVTSEAGRAALEAVQRAKNTEVQFGQLEVSRANAAREAAAANQPPQVSPDKAAELEYRREKDAADRAASAAVASGEAPPTELKKGERWNAEKGRVEAVPGSELYTKQKSTHAKDLQGAANVDRQLQDVEDAVSDLMKTSDWQKMTNTGAVMARTPNIPGLSSLTGGYDFQTKLKNLEGVLKTLGRADATASGKLGNMAIQEWRYVADAIANLDLTNMDTDDLNDQLDIIMSKAREIRSNIQGGYEQEWGGSQFYSEFPKSQKRVKAKGGRPGGVGPDWTLETDADGNKAWVSPDRQNFIEVD